MEKKKMILVGEVSKALVEELTFETAMSLLGV